MMHQQQRTDATRTEVVDMAQAIIDGRIDLIEGCRRLGSLAHAAGWQDDEVFLPIRAVDSETDRFPPTHARQHYSRRLLEQLDRERGEYVRWAQPHVVSACRAIVEKLSRQRLAGGAPADG